MKKIYKMLVCAVSVFILIAIDQITKYMATVNLKDSKPFVIINGVLELFYLPNGNTGAAFGMLKGHQILFSVIAIVVCSILFYIIYKIPEVKKYNLLIIIFVMIIAGGIGNMIDRVKQNYVVDFIYFSLIDFPIFNVADMYVSIATVLLIISVVFIYKDEDIKVIEENVIGQFKSHKSS